MQTRRQMKQIKARSLTFTDLPKIHKANLLIRTLINYTSVPGYKVSKKLQCIIMNSINFEKFIASEIIWNSLGTWTYVPCINQFLSI